MKGVQWIKITTGIFDDQKIKMIESMPEADSLLVIWLKLLVMAGKVNDSGLIYLTEKIPYSEEMLSNIFGRKLTVVRLAIETFENLDMIERANDGLIEILNWGKYQNLEGLSKIKEQGRIRQQRFRDKQKLLEQKDSVTLHNATPLISISSSESTSLEGKSKKSKARPKSIEDVSEYMKLKKCLNPDDQAERFIDHYEANGWMIGKNKMKDWKASVRNWLKRDFGNNTPQKATPTAPKLEIIKA